MPVIHRSTPATSFPQAHVIPADAGTQRKAKHAISTQTTNTPFTATPLPQQRVPAPASHSPPPPEGEIKRGSQGEGNGAAMGCGYHPNHQPPPFTPTPHPKIPNHQPVSQFVPQFEIKPCTSRKIVLPNCTSHFYLTGTAMLY